MIFFLFWVISVITAIGMGVVLVEKRYDDGPVGWINDKIHNFLSRFISPTFAKVTECPTCFSFWMALFSDVILCVIAYYAYDKFYFFWPFTGFAASGIVYLSIELLNAIDGDDLSDSEDPS